VKHEVDNFIVLEINALDYVYRSVNCQVQVMDPESDEAQYLLQCLHNTGMSVNKDFFSLHFYKRCLSHNTPFTKYSAFL